jgi:hypothetical protein
MAEETQETTPTETTGLEELASAPETGSLEEETKVEGETSQPKEVDENHPTKLGRKVKDLTEKLEGLTGLSEQVNTLTQIFNDYLASQKKTASTGDVAERYDDGIYEQMCKIEPPPLEYVTTPREQVLVRQWEERVMGRMADGMQQTYQKTYMQKVNALKEEGGDNHARIMHMVTADGSPYNKKRTGNGGADAEINYNKALAALLSGKEDKDTSKFAKGKAEGTGVTTSATKETPTKPMVKLEKEAQEWADYLGFSADERASAMQETVISKGLR